MRTHSQTSESTCVKAVDFLIALKRFTKLMAIGATQQILKFSEIYGDKEWISGTDLSKVLENYFKIQLNENIFSY